MVATSVGRQVFRAEAHPLASPCVMTWRAAMQQALYGAQGFFTAGDGPAAHFRTSAHVGPSFARTVMTLVEQVDAALGHPSRLDVVDLGAGRGELAEALRVESVRRVGLVDRLHLVAVELSPRPAHLHPTIGWSDSIPADVAGVVVANEWLDNVALDVVQVADGRTRLVEVDPSTGDEQLGAVADGEVLAWLQQWWPLDAAGDGDRAECGLTRDLAWADVVRHLGRGLAVAVDYDHTLEQRAARELAAGTLAAYRAGRQVRPVPDGSCDLTAHVALDACAAAGTRAGARGTRIVSQGEALSALGLDVARPPLALADASPRDYLTALSGAGEAAELLDPVGLGGFGWLVQSKGVAIPASLA